MASVTLELEGVDEGETVRVKVSGRNEWRVLTGGTTISRKRAAQLANEWQKQAEGGAKGYLPNRAMQYAKAGLGPLFRRARILRNTYRDRPLRPGEVH